MTGPLRTLIPDLCKFRGLRKDDGKWFLRIREVTVVLHKSEGRLFYRYSTFCGSSWTRLFPDGPEGGGGGGVPVPFPSPFFFRNPTSQCSNPIPTSRIWKKSQCYTYHLFSLRIRKITASKYDPTKTQKFTRIYKDVLKITGSFQTVIKLSGREFIEEIHLIRIRNFGQHLYHLPPFLVASL